MKTKGNSLLAQNKIFLLIALVTGLILSIPLIATQFGGSMNWGLADFILIGMLMFGAGSIFVLIARATPRKHRFLVGIGVVMVALWLWAELAVGVFTNWGN